MKPAHLEVHLLSVLAWIDGFCRKRQFSPSTRDVQLAFGLSSTSVAAYHLRLLKDRGWLTAEPAQPRTMRVTAAGSWKLDGLKVPPGEEAAS